jgi:hypothetical protein
MSQADDDWDFDKIADFLLHEGSHHSPSECHGMLSGFAAGGGKSIETVIKDLGLFLEIEQFSRQDQLTALYQSINQSFGGKDFEFSLVLPDEDQPIEQRLEALAAWCQGFLSGFAFVSNNAASKDKSIVSETLNDMAAIAQVDTSDDELGDDSEYDYANLVEFLRMGAMTVFYECVTGQVPTQKKETGALQAKSLFEGKGSDKLH